MDITLGPAQRELRGLVRDQLADVVPDDPHAVWKKLAATGLVELALPADQGGLGLGHADLCLVHEELGARLCDGRFVRGAHVVLDLWAPDSAAVAELRRRTPAVDAGRVVPLGPAPHDGPRPEVVVDVADGNRRWEPATGESEVDTSPVSADVVDAALHRDRVRGAAYHVGVARRAVELAADRVATRLLGGRPLVERQASAHRLARAAIAVELARVEVWEAACALDAGVDRHLSRTALATAVEAAITAAHAVVQLHGAAGTSDPAVGAVYRAAYGAVDVWGPPSVLWRAAADERHGVEGVAA
ncbi:alkylation response protein AidB-like acyl-CoA dehydrogenase [Saccharothrix ecbatanensis]|uniref:Alkylation response protein AidB-like acyl-CoA dehydrogenase n=1 Tax=Saccharothrix ecbatanensis TaxID=1105145 RepID=A0A7W9M2I5_9PSEU|nr:acyl-CoA dehydrogenase [Saccharothrix ecbatanensis]MBB5805002.1 alkylation response protein AidB-like acyl-CoA dehydrogenase [Saccharothrix ecbatanensis]